MCIDENIFQHYSISRQSRKQKLYNAEIVIYKYPDGRIEIVKNRYGEVGEMNIKDAVKYFSKIIADLNLKETQLDMFKEGLSQMIQEVIENTLKGEFQNERTICRESGIDGS